MNFCKTEMYVCKVCQIPEVVDLWRGWKITATQQVKGIEHMPMLISGDTEGFQVKCMKPLETEIIYS